MPSVPLSATLGLKVVVPKGQSPAAQGTDETECYALSKNETGVDPFAAPAPSADQRARFNQAIIACLVKRGYSVN